MLRLESPRRPPLPAATFAFATSFFFLTSAWAQAPTPAPSAPPPAPTPSPSPPVSSPAPGPTPTPSPTPTPTPTPTPAPAPSSPPPAQAPPGYPPGTAAPPSYPPAQYPPGYPPPGYPPPQSPPGYPPPPPSGYPPPQSPPGYPAPAPQPYPPGYPPPGYPPGYPPPGYPPGYPAAQQWQQPVDPGRHRHDGFFLRLLTGPGFISGRGETATGDSTFAGGGGAVSFALGGALGERLVLFGEVMLGQTTEPELEVDGVEVGPETDDFDVALFGMGPGLAYYFPGNFYLSGTFLISQLTMTIEGDEASSSGVGPGLSLVLAKEWWVSDNWGLGVGATFFVAGTPDDDENQLFPGRSAEWRTVGVNLLFSASFN